MTAEITATLALAAVALAAFVITLDPALLVVLGVILACAAMLVAERYAEDADHE